MGTGGGAEASFLAGGGEAGARMRSHDWAASPMGVPETWPQGLRTVVRVMLNTRHPIFIFWGPEHYCLFNDAFAASIGGERRAGALGRPGREVWAEAWDVIGPQIDQVMAGEGATWHENHLVPITRDGQLDQAYWTYSYGPIDDEAARGGVGGVLVIATETTRQVLAERRAASERERFGRLFDQAPAFMAMMQGPEHRIALANPSYMSLIGDREVLGKTVAQALPEAAEQGYLDILDGAYASGEPFSAVGARYTLRAVPDGPLVERFVDFVLQPITGPEGAVDGIFVVGGDVTARVKAERRLQALMRLTDRIGLLDDPEALSFAAAEILGTTLEVTRVGYATVDAASEVAHVERYWSAHGVDNLVGDLNMRDYGSFIDTLKRGEVTAVADVRLDPRTAAAAAALEGRGARAFVNVPILERGELVAILYAADTEVHPWAPEDLDMLLEVAARTRTAVERARVAARLRDREAQLRESNETLERRVVEALAERRLMAELVETTDAFVQAIDGDYRFLVINRANADEYEKIYGLRPKVGDSLLGLLADRPELQAQARAVWNRALGGEAFTIEEDFGDPSIEQRAYEIKFSPLRRADGVQIGAYQFSYDVTERRREQARLAEAEEQLRQSQKMEAVGQLTGGLAHDFNNLLAGISGSLEMLERRLADGRTAGIERYITAAQGASRRAAALTQRLLAFSRRQTLDPRPTDLNRLIGDMEDLVRRSVGPDVLVEVVRADGLWPTKVDASQLENSLLNLCLNARDAMAPAGGRLTIETANKRLDDRAGAELELPAGQYVSLGVTDTGSGMTPEVMARVFDPFYTTKPLGEGTGLGLSMVYGFVRQSDGQVRVYSEPGQGTTMFIYLPRFAGAAVAAAPETPDPIHPGSGEIVLVIDDEPTIRMLVVEVLEENGYATLEAEDGPSGLRILESDARIDLLITDVGLPGGMNGRQVVDAARLARPDLKVLFITGFAENAAVGNGYVERGTEVMTKPFVMSALGNKVRELINRKGESGAPSAI